MRPYFEKMPAFGGALSEGAIKSAAQILEVEKAELLGLSQSLIYSIQQTDVPQMLIVLRKGTAAVHSVMGGPTTNCHNAFFLGTATTEICVMHGETVAAASYSRRLIKEKVAGLDLKLIVEKMNEMTQVYYDNSRPLYCAQKGMVDEIVSLNQIRSYLKCRLPESQIHLSATPGNPAAHHKGVNG